MNVEHALGTLRSDSMAAELREVLSGYPGAHAGDVDRVIKWVLALREDLAVLVSEIGDPDEVTMTLAINYIELKSRWIGLNTKMNYQMFHRGSCDVVTALRGGALSALIGRIETLLTREDIEQITQFLAEPIRRAA